MFSCAGRTAFFGGILLVAEGLIDEDFKKAEVFDLRICKLPKCLANLCALVSIKEGRLLISNA